jgi:hypothetical protein
LSLITVDEERAATEEPITIELQDVEPEARRGRRPWPGRDEDRRHGPAGVDVDAPQACDPLPSVDQEYEGIAEMRQHLGEGRA